MFNGLLVIGFLGFANTLVVRLLSAFSFIKNSKYADDIGKILAIILGFGESFGWGLTANGALFKLVGISMNLWVDLVISGLAIAYGSDLVKEITNWISANREIAETKAKVAK